MVNVGVFKFRHLSIGCKIKNMERKAKIEILKLIIRTFFGGSGLLSIFLKSDLEFRNLKNKKLSLLIKPIKQLMGVNISNVLQVISRSSLRHIVHIFVQ